MPKGRVVFEYEKCKGCNLCVSFCPTKILEQSKTKTNSKGYNIILVTDPNRCIGCANCAIMCPDSVITVYKVSEVGK